MRVKSITPCSSFMDRLRRLSLILILLYAVIPVMPAGAQQEPSPPVTGDNADAGETSSIAPVDTSDQTTTVDTQSSTHLVFLPLISIPMPPQPFWFRCAHPCAGQRYAAGGGSQSALVARR
jgi:hypothetical protein